MTNLIWDRKDFAEQLGTKEEFESRVKEIEKLEFDTEQEALEYFDAHTTCMSDDVDMEDARFQRWCDNNDVIIKETL